MKILTRSLSAARNRVVPQRHLGLILSVDLQSSEERDSIALPYQITRCEDPAAIAAFYRPLRQDEDAAAATQRLASGAHCWIASDETAIRGAAWVQFGSVDLPALSGRCFTPTGHVTFGPGVCYVCRQAVDEHFRGQHINTGLLLAMAAFYGSRGDTAMVATMGASNAPNVRSWMHLGAMLEGIVRVGSLLGIVRRTEIYMDSRRAHWQ
ncbi:MAG: hypothetical protein QGH42_13690 [Kiritimatiellia bacterium]|nr:hypothetical protein [Kiritimatiellia bacterium]MDP6811166.1 hypothetical protein [Kiritimatiellia bacterium]MDP7025277.1 hypothetical protein [Kiritimatiellia bacterium]